MEKGVPHLAKLNPGSRRPCSHIGFYTTNF
jgi:hypothetical protein